MNAEFIKGRQFTAKWWRPNPTANYRRFKEPHSPNRHAIKDNGVPFLSSAEKGGSPRPRKP